MAAELAVTATGIVLSPLLQVFFDRMASREFDDFFWRRKLSNRLLKKLRIALLSVNAVLEDAEDRQFMETNVKEWLDELKDIVYDAEEILDEIATEDLQRKLDPNSETISSTVRDSISSFLFDINNIEGKIKDAIDRLEDLKQQISVLGLRPGVGGQTLERLPTTYLIEESRICGRDNEKKEIIDSLCSDDASGSEIGVIAIVGMGGIGKTTLAQLVYNDNYRVKERFDFKAWVSVSDPFDVFMVMKKIIVAVTRSTCVIEDMAELQNELKEKLRGKKFLLVLDDVWSKNYAKWEILSNAFKYGAQESKVIVTTRDFEVARVMHAGATHPIKELSKEDCWSLFAKYAFQDGNSNAYPQLEEIGGQIVKKCKGLPLAIKAIRALLWSNLDVNEWDKVLRSELWDSPIKGTEIIPALQLSYKYLSLDLKRCFAYCSIFPKDYAFTKNTLVLLWMAEGLLPKPKNKAMEEVGGDYFLTLESRSLFQRSNSDTYLIHDLVSDLAKFISKQFTLSHEDDCSREIGINTRHFSYDSSNFHIKKFETFPKDMRLRTIVRLYSFGSGYLVGKLETLFSLPMIRCLRVLILSHHEDLSELPDSIGKFKLLRYLDFSYTKIKRLPDSICKLCNLQILNLAHCFRLVALPRDMHKLLSLQILNLFSCQALVALPRDMHKLSNLRLLNIAETWIRETPINLGELKCLQTLSTFIVNKRNGSGIEELGKLTNLRGSLSVLELQNVESPTDAKGKNLKDKKLEKLVLEWKVDIIASESHNIVLDSLEPHLSLKSLNIDGYGGTSFPKWVGDTSFSHIASLYLRNCKFCCSLPPLGQLPSLQDLWINGLDGVVKVGSEFYGIGSSSMKPFGALKFLMFSEMIGWEEWFSFEGEAFSKLEKLCISKCPKLTGGLPTHLPSLAELFIDDCPRLVASLPRASSLCSLTLSNCNTVLLNESLTGIDELRIESCSKLGYCDSLKSFPLFSKLRQLYISNCGDLESLTVGEQHEHDLLLSEIEIHRCPNFAYFPQGGLRAPNLKVFEIEDCRSLRSLPEKMHILLPSLEELRIIDCPQVESFPEGGWPSNLNTILILNCDKLFASQMGWGCGSLKSFPLFSKLGKLVISNCGDLESLTVGEQHEHDLLLWRIQIQRCPDFAYFPQGGLRAPNLKEFMIWDCRSLRSLPEKMHILLPSLEKLYIKDCPQVESFPEGGLPSKLNEISILNCDKLFASRMGWGLQNLPCVRSFTIGDKSEDVESFPEEGLLPASLTHLDIKGFPNLKSLDKKGLQHITALEELQIWKCPKLECMPEDGLPASLSTLEIYECPLLEKEWERKEGEEWRKIAHVPQKYMNQRQIE